MCQLVAGIVAVCGYNAVQRLMAHLICTIAALKLGAVVVSISHVCGDNCSRACSMLKQLCSMSAICVQVLMCACVCVHLQHAKHDAKRECDVLQPRAASLQACLQRSDHGNITTTAICGGTQKEQVHMQLRTAVPCQCTHVLAVAHASVVCISPSSAHNVS